MAAPWRLDPGIMVYKVGTCHGQYSFTDKGIEIISVVNDNPHNGHLDDVFEWFEFSARVNKRDLFVRGFLNKRFRKHCLEKRGFKQVPNSDDVYKKI